MGLAGGGGGGVDDDGGGGAQTPRLIAWSGAAGKQPLMWAWVRPPPHALGRRVRVFPSTCRLWSSRCSDRGQRWRC